MKKKYSLFIALTTILLVPAITFATETPATEEVKTDYSLTESLQNGEFSLNSRVFYMDRSFDKPDTEDAEALTAGGIMKYESGGFHNFKMGLAGFGSFSLFNIVDRDKSSGTSLLQSNGDDIAFMGEAYIDFNTGQNQLKGGYQRLNTPLMNDHDLRMLPTSYAAVVYRNKSFQDTTLEAGYVNQSSGFVSTDNGYEDQADEWGDSGLAYIYGITKLKGVDLRGQFIATLEDSGTYENYGFFDVVWPIGIGDKSYMKGQLAYTAYQQESNSTMYGMKMGTTFFGKLDVDFLYNGISDNLFATVEAGPMYSDWQQGYGNYEPSDAFGGQLIYHPWESVDMKVGYVDVSSKSGDEWNLDNYGETNVDLQYAFNEEGKIRLRYSHKEQDDNAVRENRDDLRLIFYYNF